MRYCVLYPKTENVNLIKDVGMIAYKLNKLYGYESTVATYKNGEYPYLDSEVKGLEIDFIKREKNHFSDIYSYLKKNALKIDVLQIFHMTANSVLYALLYKFFNKRGTIFLKLDCSKLLIEKLDSMNSFQRKLLDVFLSKVDIIGVEQKKLFDELKLRLKKHAHKLLNVTNGLDFDKEELKATVNFKDKENVILSVGRIGSPEKRNDMLMEAFAALEESSAKAWKLVFVGPVEEEFKLYIEEFFKQHPDMKKRIIFKGAVYDRSKLYEEYKRAKIFCLTSEFESFGIVLIEAGAFGDVIISTRVGIAEEIVYEDNGRVIEVGDASGLKDAMEELILSPKLCEAACITESYCKQNYNWDAIVEKLHYKIMSIKGNDIHE